MRLIASIDPGLTGAIVIWRTGSDWLDDDIVTISDMPVVDGEVDATNLALILGGVTEAVVERQQSMPKQGVASTFKTGVGFGIIKGVLAGAQIPSTYVPSTTWTRVLGVGSDKEAHRRRAIELYPAHAQHLCLKKHHGRADGILVGHWWLHGR